GRHAGEGVLLHLDPHPEILRVALALLEQPPRSEPPRLAASRNELVPRDRWSPAHLAGAPHLERMTREEVAVVEEGELRIAVGSHELRGVLGRHRVAQRIRPLLETLDVTARVPGEEHHGQVAGRAHALAEEAREHEAGLEPLVLGMGAREVLPRLLVGHLLEHAARHSFQCGRARGNSWSVMTAYWL